MKSFEASSWLLQRGVRTNRYSLDRMNFILDELNKPQRDYVCILIGGTNGKGSVTAIIEAIMSNCPNYVSGSLTSPHLANIRERIKIMGKPIPDKYWCSGVEQLIEISKILDKDASLGSVSFFESITALAFWGFREAEIDLAILEVGLGGRFDATNTCEPEISIITNIGTDHQEYLGEGKISIAREKLEIARRKRPLITGEKSPEILNEFAEVCKKKQAQLIIGKSRDYFELLESKANGHLIKTIFSEEPIIFPLPGNHQLENLTLALEAISQLIKNGFEIPDETIIKGITETKWLGRLQWIDKDPPVLLDGAHNTEGIEALLEYLSGFPPAKPMNIILGVLQNKPLKEMAEKLKKIGNKLYFVPPNCPRAVTHETFIETLEPIGWQWFDSFEKAYESSKINASSILVVGSLYLISDALKVFNKQCLNLE